MRPVRFPLPHGAAMGGIRVPAGPDAYFTSTRRNGESPAAVHASPHRTAPVRMAQSFYPAAKGDVDNSANVLVMLHGLMGWKRNLAALASVLSSGAPYDGSDGASDKVTAAPPVHVYCCDVRNHGESPHAPVHSLQAIAADVDDFIEAVVKPAHPNARIGVVGHSMGGMAVMHYLVTRRSDDTGGSANSAGRGAPTGGANSLICLAADTEPSAAVILDISPGKRPASYEQTVADVVSLSGADLSAWQDWGSCERGVRSLLQCDTWMARYYATNLVQRPGPVEGAVAVSNGVPQGAFGWRCNIGVIAEGLRSRHVDWYPQLAAATCSSSCSSSTAVEAEGSGNDSNTRTEATTSGATERNPNERDGDRGDLGRPQSTIPTLFVFGEKSPYFSDAAVSQCRRFFPRLVVDVVPGAGHFAPVLNPTVVAAAMGRFLAEQFRHSPRSQL